MVYELFPGAISPAIAVLYNPNPPEFEEKLVYGTPKPSPFSQHIKAILLDTTEIKYLDRKHLVTNPHIWKVALWGTPRDEALIERLVELPTLQEQLKELGWKMQEGFMAQYEGSDKNVAGWLYNMPFVSASNFTSYVAKPDAKVKDKVFHRPRTKEVFKAPLAIIHHSQCQAAFSDSDVSFHNSISSISGREGQESLLKWLVCIINSPLIRYFQFLTSTRWAVERANPLHKEFLQIPFVLPNKNDPRLIQVIYHFDEIAKALDQENAFFDLSNAEKLDKHKSAINSLIYDVYSIFPAEQCLIEDMLDYGIGFFNWAKRKNRKPYSEKAVRRPNVDVLKTYASTFKQTVSKVLKTKNLLLNSVVYKNGAPLTVTSFNIVNKNEEKPIRIMTQPDAMRKKLRELDNLLVEQQTPSIYIRRHVRIYDNNQVSLVRPSEQRFWTRSQALADADAFLAELAS